MIACGVILYKHHLRALLQGQHLARRIGVFWEVAFYLRLECIAVARQFLQFVLVVTVRQIVMGGQADIALTLFGNESRLASLVQDSNVVGRGLRLTDMIQHIEEGSIFLTKHLAQQDRHIFYLLERLRAKEIRRVIIGFQQRLILWGHHRRQLLQIANHQQLHAAEGLIMITIPSQYGVDGIKQITSYHRDLIDNQQVE